MPRKARTDAPGALHHIIARGIERRTIFSDNDDRENYLVRLVSFTHRLLQASLFELRPDKSLEIHPVN
ncbi:MAG: hypothetical protein ACYS0I_21165 [Planctomycetota bacterium]|jgi:hypothetical protein